MLPFILNDQYFHELVIQLFEKIMLYDENYIQTYNNIVSFSYIDLKCCLNV